MELDEAINEDLESVFRLIVLVIFIVPMFMYLLSVFENYLSPSPYVTQLYETTKSSILWFTNMILIIMGASIPATVKVFLDKIKSMIEDLMNW